MKNIIKFAYASLASLLAVTFVSCTDSFDYEGPGEQDPGAFINAVATTLTYAAEDEQVLTFTLQRTNPETAETINLIGDNSKFQVPTSVSFNAGEEKKFVNVPFNITGGTTETLKITVAPESATVYGNDNLTFTVTRDYVWTTVGKGQWLDGFWYGFWTEVTIQQREDAPEIYRIKNPYTTELVQAYGETPGTYTDYYVFNLGKDGLVSWDKFFYINTVNTDYGVEMKGYYPSSLNPSQAAADELSYAETDEDGNILFFQICPYWYMDGVGGYGAKYPCYLAFPGVDLATEWDW